MKLVKHNDDHFELRGRQVPEGEAGAGFWVLWVVACAFLGCAALIWGISGEKEARLMGFLSGLIGSAILVVGVYLVLKRQSVIFDLNGRRGAFMTWSPWQGSRVERKFRFDEIDSLTLRQVSEAVSSPVHGVGDGPGQIYEKLELRLRIRPRTVIRVLRSANKQRVRELAKSLSRILEVPVIE